MKRISVLMIATMILGGCVTSPGFMNPASKPTKIKVSHVKQEADKILPDGTVLRGGSETTTVEGSAGAGVDLAKTISFVKEVDTKKGTSKTEFAGDTTLNSADQAVMVTDQSRLQAELLGMVIPAVATMVADTVQRFMNGSSGADDDPGPVGVGLEEIISMLPPGVSLREVIQLLERPDSGALIEGLLNR